MKETIQVLVAGAIFHLAVGLCLVMNAPVMAIVFYGLEAFMLGIALLNISVLLKKP